MPWPTPQDYNEAIQNPAHAFSDAELRTARPEVTSLGLPRPITGNFASVYRVHCGARDWAVRCFWREYADMQSRYAAISSYLQAQGLPYTVGFEYLPRGIQIRGQWYPILKMEWVEGILLNDCVEKNLHDAAALRDLARRWRDMVRSLEVAGIAHGDLQHGNVLVVGNELKLVDYDAMFVPALGGTGSHELGHQNYQHPARSAQDFGPWLDRFSAGVVYLSLLALAQESSLWHEHNAGDECLLFRRADFSAPDTSPLFARLSGLGNSEVSDHLVRLRHALDRTPRQIPPLIPGDLPAATRVTSTARLPSRVEGMLRVIAPSAPLAALTESPAASGALPPWLRDHVSPPAAEFGAPSRLPRAAAICGGGLVVLLVIVAVLGMLPFLLLSAAVVAASMANLLVVLVGYRREEAVCEIREIMCREVPHRRRLNGIERIIRRLERQQERAEARLREEVERLAMKEQLVKQAEEQEHERIGALCGEMKALVVARRAAIDDRESGDVTSALEDLRASHVRHFLAGRRIRRREVPDLPWQHRTRLWLAGVRTAADIDAERMRSATFLAKQGALALATWRVTMELEARRSMPASLSERDRIRIAKRYRRARSRADVDSRWVEDIEDRLALAHERRYAERYRAIQVALSRARQDHQAREVVRSDRLTDLREAGERELCDLARLGALYRPFVGITLRAYLGHVYRSSPSSPAGALSQHDLP